MRPAARFGWGCALAVALAHLLLVGLGAAGIDWSDWEPGGRLLELYGNASGADRGYSFFAPGVTGQYRAQFDLIDRQGRSQTVDLFPSQNGEANLRFGDIIDQFATSTADSGDLDDDQERIDFARSLAASLAGAMFGRHPEAAAVRVRLEEFLPVGMTDYRAGVRPEWHPLYQAKFMARHPLAQREGR